MSERKENKRPGLDCWKNEDLIICSNFDSMKNDKEDGECFKSNNSETQSNKTNNKIITREKPNTGMRTRKQSHVTAIDNNDSVVAHQSATLW